MIDEKIFDILTNTNLEKKDRVELVIRNFHTDLGSMVINVILNQPL